MKLYFLILFLLFTSLPKIESKNWWLNLKAQTITQDNFKSIVGKDKHVIIDFFTPWCQYCQRMSDHWNSIFDHYNRPQTRNDVIVAKMNCEEEQQFCAEHHVHSFPTIKHYPKHKLQAEAHHHGPRTFENFQEWIENSCGPQENNKQQDQNQNQNQNQNKQQQQEQQNQAIQDSEGLFKEIKSQLEDGLADLPKKVHNVELQHFNTMDSEEKADVLFDQVHSIKREMQELNSINDKNLNLLNKVINQADKLQDERITLQEKISKINNEIDEKKDQIIQIAKQLHKNDQNNEDDEEDSNTEDEQENQQEKQNNNNQQDNEDDDVKNLHEIHENVKQASKLRQNNKNEIKIWQFIAVLFAGASIGFLSTIVIHKISNKKKSYENDSEAYKMN